MMVYEMARHLGTAENKDYSLELSAEVGEGDSISSVVWDWLPQDGELVIQNTSWTGTVITAWATTPAAGTSYAVWATVTTGLGKILQYRILLGGVDKEKAYGS